MQWQLDESRCASENGVVTEQVYVAVNDDGSPALDPATGDQLVHVARAPDADARLIALVRANVVEQVRPYGDWALNADPDYTLVNVTGLHVAPGDLYEPAAQRFYPAPPVAEHPSEAPAITPDAAYAAADDVSFADEVRGVLDAEVWSERQYAFFVARVAAPISLLISLIVALTIHFLLH